MKKNHKWNNKNILKKEQVYYNDPEKLYYICPNCQCIITFGNAITEDIILACPICGQEGITQASQKKQHITDTNVSNHIMENATLIDKGKNINIPAIEVKIVGIILIIIGIALFYFVNLYSIKVALMIIIIGVVIFTFIPNNRLIFIKFHRTKKEEKSKNELNTHNYSFFNYFYNFLKNQFDISEKIAIALIIWIIFIYILTGVNDIDIFLIFIFLGILIIKVLFDDFFPLQFRQRMNIFVIAFLLIFIIIVIRRFLNMASI